MKKPKYKHVISSDDLALGCNKRFESDMANFIDQLSKNPPKFIVTGKDGKSYIIDQDDIKSVNQYDAGSIR